ncbi:hypothetical protein P7H21_11310 [Paenibacillus larvae]|nr:hypothetical protein [Paenibacillus larvae]MDT2304433.1 hypothetical protein [Paenibacillus larvae]
MNVECRIQTPNCAYYEGTGLVSPLVALTTNHEAACNESQQPNELNRKFEQSGLAMLL